MRLKFALVLVVLCLIFVSLIGGVSADTNWAASANGATLSITGVQMVRTTEVGSKESINDENFNTYYGIEGTDYYTKWKLAKFTTIITLENPSKIDRIVYKDYLAIDPAAAPLPGSWVSREYYIQYSGSMDWVNILYNQEEGIVNNFIDGPWNNVAKINVTLTAFGDDANIWATWFSDPVYAHLFEIRAIEYGTSSECGNGICENAEGNCLSSTCPQDCACKIWETCQENVICSRTSECNDNDIIMKLYQSNNSHGALWDYSDYNWDICYSDYFGIYNGDLGIVHNCASGDTNKVLNLYQNNNSHAAIDDSTGYNIPVCYGDLDCISEYGSCSSGRTAILSLYQENNSHIAEGDFLGYNYKICCKSIAPAGDVYWADMKGNPINSAEIGDTVLMIYNKPSGSYNYEIWEDDLFENNSWFDDEIRTITNSFILNEKVAAKWTITQADYEKGNSLEDMEFLNNNHEEFYFKVDNVNSAKLFVNQSSYNNSIPYTDIINPLNGANYTIDGSSTGNINFEQISSDEDDDLKILWSFGDGTNSIWLENCLTTGNCNTIHSYSNSGYKVIKLTAKEMGRSVPQTALDYAGVYVYKKGTNVFAVITKPEFGKPAIGRFIQIDAHNSFAAECDSSSCPSVCSGICYIVIDALTNPSLQCCNYPKNNSLIFNWTFDDGTSKYGNWQDDYDKVVNFTKFFAEAGEHEIKLKVGYNKG